MPRSSRADYLIALALTGETITLETKPINLPNLPTTHEEEEPDWHKQIMRPEGASEWRNLYISCQRHRIEYWEKLVRAFETNPGDFHNAYHYLNHHPAFWHFFGKENMTAAERIHEKWLIDDDGFRDSVSVYVVKVNPTTSHSEDDTTLNTKTEVWIELGKHGWPHDDANISDTNWHDVDLDCGADTFEQAVITAAIHLHAAYGNDRMLCDKEE